MASSKTARRSTPQGPAGKFQPDAQASRLVPLAGGMGAYVFDADGKMKRYDTNTPEFLEALVAYADALGVERVVRDLKAANQESWARFEEELRAALAPSE